MSSFGGISQTSASKRIIQLYSGNRNRCLYPLPASFTVPFAAVVPSNQNPVQAQDPVCQGAIEYQFVLYGTYYSFISGVYREGSTQSHLGLVFGYETFENDINNYYNGFRLVDVASNESHLIQSYDETTQFVTLDRPFNAPIAPGGEFLIYSIYPTRDKIFIPTQDVLGNQVKRTPLAYNGYYVVFETPRSEYSNPWNSNVLSRRISYYDHIHQIAYFDKPLPFTFPDNEAGYQTFTLRKHPPMERWLLDKASYFNTTPPVNSEIGPLVGPVVALPDGASTTDNLYKNRFIYVYSNSPQTYSPPLPKQTLLTYPIPGITYPIYGLYLITAYNGQTRECSVSEVCVNELTKSELPTYQPLPEYSSASFRLEPTSNISSIVHMGGTTYRAYLDLSQDFTTFETKYAGIWIDIPGGRPYEFHLRVRRSASILSGNNSGWFRTSRSTIEYASSVNVEEYYQDYIFSVSINADASSMGIEFFCETFNNEDPAYIEWDLFTVTRSDTINILNFSHDNFSPLDYAGTLVSSNQPVCYDISILSLTLPNKLLLTGSRIAFYPFVYVEIQNVTAPSAAGFNLITSNNPHSTRAMFQLPVPQVPDPELQAFVTLSGGGTQVVKFKPNDNLKISVFLSDGTLFQTLTPDLFPPYSPDPGLQVDLTFTISRSV